MAERIELQAEYQDWLDSLPENLRDGATAEALAAVCALVSVRDHVVENASSRRAGLHRTKDRSAARIE